VIRLDVLCGEGRTVPGWQWLTWDEETRKTARAELADQLVERLTAEGLVVTSAVSEFTRVDEQRGLVTLLAEVYARGPGGRS
jgi:hypothetical protein